MVVKFNNAMNADEVSALWTRTVAEAAASQSGATLTLDASDCATLGGAASALAVELRRIANERGLKLELRDPHGSLDTVFRVFPAEKFAKIETGLSGRSPSLAAQVGESTMRIWRDFVEQLAFLGEMVSGFLRLMFHPGRLRWRETLVCFERAGIDALPITLLIGFLIGLILAFMSAASLRQFGVEVYVADLIAIGLFRELGPIITSIILAGRSGSAFAAEIGTMKVNEELDALVTFGIRPAMFLAMPRVVAATLVMPVLTIFAVTAGLVGGAMVLVSMQVPPVTYLNHVTDSITLPNVLFGLGKSAVFGTLVGMVGCSHGLQTGRTADAVGRAATAAVVGSLVLITVFDGAFAVVAYFAGV